MVKMDCINFPYQLSLVLITYVCMVEVSDSEHQSGDQTQLVLVQVVFRHGDRSPIQAYPTDKHQEKNWPRGFGQLSKEGMMQHYQLGQFFKSRYIRGYPYTLLAEEYNKEEIYIRSTDVDRTLMSASCNLAGLYPPDSSEEWNPQLAWQPLPVHTVPSHADHLLDTDSYCPKADKLFNDTMQSAYVKEEEKRDAEFFKFLSEKSGYDHEGLRIVWKLYDTIFCEKQHNMTQPSWVEQEWNNTGQTAYKKLMELDLLNYKISFNSTEQQRLRGGPLLKELILNMQGKINKSLEMRDKKFFMYSAHDTTVAAVSRAMGIFNDIHPPYASTIIVELHTSDSGHLVKVFFRNDSTVEPYSMEIVDCGNPCYFTNFTTVTAPVIPGDIKIECELSLRHDSTDLTTVEMIIIVAGGTLLVMGVAAILLYKRNTGILYVRHHGLEVNA